MNIKFIFCLLCLIYLFGIGCQPETTRYENVLTNYDLDQYDYFVDLPDHFWGHINQVSVQSDRITALGRALFYDPRLSINDRISCSSCHEQKLAFADGLRFSSGVFNEQTSRNSMSLVNPGLSVKHFWDIEANGLLQAVMLPIQNHVEMGIRDLSSIKDHLEATDFYSDLFFQVFGNTQNSEITEENISLALTHFVGSLQSYQSKFDEGLPIDFVNFTVSENNGREIFFNKGNCEHCHESPLMTRNWSMTANIGLDMDYQDEGWSNGKFKIPTLRNIELTAPYMHDGRFSTLEQVIEHYDHGVQNHPNLSWALTDPLSSTKKPKKLNLTDTEKEDLVAFLKTLTDNKFISDPKFSNPFK